MSNAAAILSDRLRAVRIGAGLTMAELAHRADVGEDRLSRFEAGSVSALTTGTLVRLAEILKVPRAIFLDSQAPFDQGQTPHTLLKTAAVRGYGHLTGGDEEALAAALARAHAWAELRVSLGRTSLLGSFSLAPAPDINAHEAGYQDAGRVRELLVGRDGALFGLRRVVEDSFGILVPMPVS
jgi:transcriptional regulator with XRE-family HTH domain